MVISDVISQQDDVFWSPPDGDDPVTVAGQSRIPVGDQRLAGQDGDPVTDEMSNPDQETPDGPGRADLLVIEAYNNLVEILKSSALGIAGIHSFRFGDDIQVMAGDVRFVLKARTSSSITLETRSLKRRGKATDNMTIRQDCLWEALFDHVAQLDKRHSAHSGSNAHTVQGEMGLFRRLADRSLTF